jgi:pimeloyl-ACP methyl ester carboxylesterase
VPHRDPGPAAGTILASEGGPGVSSTAAAGGYADLFGPLLDRRDLLLIDLRGTGRSGVIDCPELQHAIGDPDSARRACAAQLGAGASLYGSGDRSEDIEDVRAALGISRFDYFGVSGGGLQVQAYAARYPDRLRTAVLDAPYRVGFDDAFQSPVAGALVRSAALVCERSPSCQAADPHPRRTLRALLERVRREPVPGRALARGDAAPLLRMAAETDGPEFTDQGDPREYSDGDFVATYCTDGVFPWDKAAPEAARRAQYDAAVSGLRAGSFAPFSVAAWLGSRVPPADDCLAWPGPGRPALPPRASIPGVRALVLTGDLDLAVPSENAAAVAAKFPLGQLVRVANVGHPTARRSQCARELILRFIETAAPVDAGCASQFNPTYGVGEFSLRAAQAPLPPDAPGDRSGRLDRRVAAVAWAAAYDAIQRSFRMGGGTGVGLRGGSFSVDGGTDFAYEGVRFAADVAVSGGAHVDYSIRTVSADLVVDAPGGEDGTLAIAGRLFPHTGPLPARGTIGGRPVAVLVPSA